MKAIYSSLILVISVCSLVAQSPQRIFYSFFRPEGWNIYKDIASVDVFIEGGSDRVKLFTESDPIAIFSMLFAPWILYLFLLGLVLTALVQYKQKKGF